jgi:hypothetical protein
VVLKHASYSPDLAPYDFLLFPTMKNRLKESHSEGTEEIQEFTIAVLNNLLENYFWKCFVRNNAGIHVQLQEGTSLKETAAVQNKM